MSSVYLEDEDGGPDLPFLSSPRGHKPPPFDRSDAREQDIRLAESACAAMGCESITSSQARQWAEIEKRRVQYADYRERAKRRKAAKGKA